MDLYYLRMIFSRHSRWINPVHSTAFHYLWQAYSFNLSFSSNCVLRYSALAFEVISHVVFDRHILSQVDFPLEYYEYTSQFLNGLRKAIKENTIDETHLFAVFFAVLTGRMTAWFEPEESNTYFTYLGVFCSTLEHLINRQAKARRTNSTPLWRLLLSHIRRLHRFLRSFATVTQDPRTHFYPMHLLDIKIPWSNEMDPIVATLPGLALNIKWCSFLHCWDVTDLTMSFQSAFNHICRRPAGTTAAIDTATALKRLIDSIRRGSDGFEKFKYLDGIYQVKFGRLLS